MIFVTKYRKKILLHGMADDAKQFLHDAARQYGYTILTMETDKGHVHVLVQYKPKDSVASMSKHLKQHSTHKNTGNTKFYGQTDTLRQVSAKRRRPP